MRGCSISKSQLKISPVSVCQIGSDVQDEMPLTNKLLVKLDTPESKPYFKLIPGPQGTQPAVLLSFETLVRAPYQTQKVKRIIARLQISQCHPQSIPSQLDEIGKAPISCSMQDATAKYTDLQVGIMSHFLVLMIMLVLTARQHFLNPWEDSSTNAMMPVC